MFFPDIFATETKGIEFQRIFGDDKRRDRLLMRNCRLHINDHYMFH